MEENIKNFEKIKKINNFLDKNRSINNCFVVFPFILSNLTSFTTNKNFNDIYNKIVNNDLTAISDIEEEIIARILLQKAGRIRFLKNFSNFSNLLDSAIECISFNNYIGAISTLSLMIEPLEKQANKYLNNNFEKNLNDSLFKYEFFERKIEKNEKEIFFKSKLYKITYKNIQNRQDTIENTINKLYKQIEDFCNKKPSLLPYKSKLEEYFMNLNWISVFLNSSNNLKEIFWYNKNKPNYCEFFNRNKIAHTFDFFNNILNKKLQYKITAGLICLINYFTEVLFIGEGYYETNGISIIDNISLPLPTEEISSKNEEIYNKISSNFTLNEYFITFKKILNQQFR